MVSIVFHLSYDKDIVLTQRQGRNVKEYLILDPLKTQPESVLNP